MIREGGMGGKTYRSTTSPFSFSMIVVVSFGGAVDVGRRVLAEVRWDLVGLHSGQKFDELA